MSYDAFETTNGQPVELLTFRNGDEVWRYTNANIPLTIGAFEYAPLAYRRTAPVNSKNSDDARVRFALPGDIPVVELYTTILTSNVTTATIERFHNNDTAQELVVYWKGEVGSVNRADAMAEMLAIPFSEAPHEIPSHTYQATCNVFLYEGVCGNATDGVSRDDFKHDGVVSVLATVGTVVTVPGLRVQAGVLDAGVKGELTSDELDIYWLAGYVKTADEFRPVMQANVGGDPDTVRILQPFRNLSVGDAVTVFAGCDHSMSTCHRKFDNVDNFQGHPYTPIVNPFRTELPPGSRSPVDPSDFIRAILH